MKKIIKIALQIILINALFFTSCDKSPYLGTGLIIKEARIDSLTGRKFIFNDLTWQTGGGGELSVNVELPNSQLFLNREIKVSIVNAVDAIEVPFYMVEFGFGALPVPYNKGFIYDNTYFDSLFLFAIGANKNQLVGTRVSLKVEIL